MITNVVEIGNEQTESSGEEGAEGGGRRGSAYPEAYRQSQLLILSQIQSPQFRIHSLGGAIRLQ